jgi:hypothetical protein
MSKVAVLSIATNGYAAVFEDCLNSQRLYCRRFDYDYFVVEGSPPWGIGASESSWLKIPLLLRFLKSKNYSWVCFFDADCFVQACCPKIETVDDGHRYAFLGNDVTGRVNAGVMLIKTGAPSIRLLRRIAWSAWVPSRFVPKECKNLYENGHVIWMCRNSEHVGILDPRWNYSHGMQVEGEYVSHGIGRYFDKPRLGPARNMAIPVRWAKIRPALRPVVNSLLARYYWNMFELQKREGQAVMDGNE